MLFFARLVICAAVFCCVLFAAGHLWAEEDKGQEDLNLATETKLSAENIVDLGEVVRLCESAMEKGLDEGNTQFAKHLLAATLVQRADIASKTIFRGGTVDPKWNDYRSLALADLEKAVKLVPEEPEALVLIAKLNFLPRGNKARAIEALDRAIAIAGGDKDLRAAALVLRAGAQKDPQKRLADLQEALRIAPQMVQALRARGFHYATIKKSQEALEDLQAAEKIDPNHPATVEYLALILARLQKYDRALEKLDRLQKLRPNRVSPLLIKAQIHATRSNIEEAMKCLDQAVKLQPDNSDVLLLRAGLYNDMKQPDKALADVDRVLELEPNHDKARRSRVILLARAGKIDEVVAELKTILKDSPHDVPVQMQLAMLYTMKDQPRKAIDVYTNILAKNPKNAGALVGRAGSYLTVGDHDKSIADYEQALQLGAENKDSPHDVPIRLQLAMLYTIKDQPRKAIDIYTNVLANNPKNAGALAGRASSYLTVGNHAKSIADYEQALQLGAENSGMFNNFAWVLATSPEDKLRDGKRAVELAAKACELTDYKQAHILSTLAAAYAESGNFEEALKWSTKAVELSKTGADKEIQENLAKELKSYEKGEPWREMLSEKKKEDDKPSESEATKPETKTPQKPEKTESEAGSTGS